jgi:hypothetical protein
MTKGRERHQNLISSQVPVAHAVCVAYFYLNVHKNYNYFPIKLAQQRILHEKLIVVQVVMKFPASHGTRMLITVLMLINPGPFRLTLIN